MNAFTMAKKICNFPVALMLLLMLLGCQTDQFNLSKLDDDMVLEQEWASPLIRGKLNFENLVESFDSTSLVNTDEQGLLYFIYEDSVFSKSAQDEITIPNQNYLDVLYTVPVTIPNYNRNKTAAIDTMHKIGFEHSANPDSILTDQFTMRQSVNSSIQHDIQVIITYISIVKNGKPFKDTLFIPPGGQIVETNQKYGYTIIPAPSDTSEHKFLKMHYDVTIYGNGNNLNAGELVNIENKIESIDIQSVYGYLGQETLLEQQGKISLNIFDLESDGTLEFADPQFRFLINNSYGVPIEVQLTDVRTHYQDKRSQPIIFKDSANIFDIRYPEFPGQFGASVRDSILITNDSCNLSEALTGLPDYISFEATGVSNPHGKEESNYNFVTENSTFTVNSEVILPLWLKANGIALKDTFDLDLGAMLNDTSNLKHLLTKFHVYNGLPVDIDLQVYFLDEDYRMIDTIFRETDRPVIEGAMVDDNGEVINSKIKRKTTISEFDGKDFQDLSLVDKMIFQASLKTSAFEENIKVKFYKDYTVRFNMAVEFKTEFNIGQ